MTDPFAEYRALLQRIEGLRRRLHTDEWPRAKPQPAWRRWALRAAAAVAAVCLPFCLLVGASVGGYRLLGLPTWAAFLLGVCLTAALLVAYTVLLWRRIGGRWRLPRRAVHATLAVVGAYCLYSLVYLSGLNVKEEALRSRYRSLHPLLRLATSTVILADRDLVITDMSRELADYARMGLPPYERSLHFIQQDGYAHAVDLRTRGRSWWRNLLLRGYFCILGFRTLRHVGTADHLHVSLPPH